MAVASSASASSWRLPPAYAPLRAEPFGVERLEQHARDLAQALASATVRGGQEPAFFRDFAANARALRDANAIVSTAAQSGEPLTTEAEWLIDNFYIVEEQLREIRDDLPRPFYRELPKASQGEARVHVLALELLSHTDSVLDEEMVVRFVREFQTVTPLTMGELWALPIMLRLVLVENLRRIAAQMLASRASEGEARRLIADWDQTGKLNLDLTNVSESSNLIVCLIEELQGGRPDLAEKLRELDRQLGVQQVNCHQVVHAEHQRQAANQVSIGNVITSMRLISSLDWVAFFERTSLAEAVLRKDPAGAYPQMDFESRDRYRHVVERIAKGSRVPETQVATHAIELAAHEETQSPSHHVGYWLVGEGLPKLKGKYSFRPTLSYRLTRSMRRRPHATYLGLVALITSLVVATVVLLASTLGVAPVWLVLLACLLLVPASELAVGLANVLITSWLPPWLLPKLDFQSGIPPGERTIVVIPSLLSSADEVKSLVERLEMHYLANPDPALSFALLTDWSDAPQEHLPHDEALVEQARRGIRALNAQHSRSKGGGPFYLFHRSRQWNEREGRWMGWERKRGKLLEFHRLLRRQGGTSYIVVEGNVDQLYGSHADPVRYVLTLDSDTHLPHGTVRRMVGTLAHPLNRPRFNAADQLSSGYVLLQPRVSVHLTSANRSRFARLFANNPGVDPYSTSASDLYQDLYGEGSFTGKGLYDLDAFETLLGDTFPENQILSHDLIEGCHSRVALVSDMEVFDHYPPRYEAEARRQHRWVRGDWQILPWLLPWVPSAEGGRRNRLSLLSRWKIFDNLRRSLVAPSLFAWLLFGWLAVPQLAMLATLAGLLVLAFPLLTQLAMALRGWPRDVSFGGHAQAVLRDLQKSLLQALFLLAVLPHKAWLAVDAIARTLFRMLVSRRKLLEWETASEVERRMSASPWSALLHLWFVPVAAVVIGVLLPPQARLAAAPLLLAWLVAPWLSFWLSQPPRSRSSTVLSADQSQQLRLQARRIWSFFEAYVGPEGNWLPPDNVQEYPDEKIANRISPTNEGLFLVSGLVARDLGYITLHDLTTLWEHNLASWQRLDRLEGHFYNWYETTSLRPLLPRYVSTVDSGNLAVSLLTMKQGIEDHRHQDLMGDIVRQGLHDTLEMILIDADRLGIVENRQAASSWPVLRQTLTALRELPALTNEGLAAAGESIAQQLPAFRNSVDNSHIQLLKKLELLVHSLHSLRTEEEALFPWQRFLSTLPADAEPWLTVRNKFAAVRSLQDLIELPARLAPELAELVAATERLPQEAQTTAREWLVRVQEAVAAATRAAGDLDNRLTYLAALAERMALGMNFRFLFDPQRKLFSIGFNLEDGKLDRSRYDMLCSEARLASFLAIAKGDVEAKHWFQLGRQLTQTAGQLALLSWGGTMFEYAMPPLFMHAYDSSLLDQSARAAVARQQEFGRQTGLPWGVSECAFGALAINSDYHYRSFGVPGLGLKRGLSKDLVVSPYSTFLAIEIDPTGALVNLERMERAGGLGHWGFYEALDYTPERVPPGRRLIVVRCHMSHHQGMSLIALGNLLCGGSTRRRFHAHALVRATELLLQERVPQQAPKYQPHAEEGHSRAETSLEQELVSRKLVGVTGGPPRTHLLSNGEYSVMLTGSGSGYSHCNEIALSRWRPDATRDHWGQFLYLRDVHSQRVWSPTFQPTCVEPDSYEVVYSIDKADFHRRDGDLETHLEIVVSPENNAEVRQLRITNHSAKPRQIEITSLVEIALTTQPADVSHPAFHKLFVETEYIPEEATLLAKRRPRDAQQPPTWAVHTLSPAGNWSDFEYETNRQLFLGRNRDPSSPQAMTDRGPLSGTTGAVLDPIFALRCRVKIPAHESVAIGFTTALAKSREEALALADQYHDPRGVQRAFELAWAYSQVELRHLHVSPAMSHLYQRLGSPLLYPNAAYRAPAETILANRLGQRSLWPYGISGDLPIVLVHVTHSDQVELVRELLTAQTYLQGRGLKSDLVMLNDSPGSYLDALQDQLVTLVNERQVNSTRNRLGVYLLRAAQMSAADKVLLDTTAAVVLHGERGSLSKQLEAAAAQATPHTRAIPAPKPGASHPRGPLDQTLTSPHHVAVKDLEFWNGSGGFAHAGREYHIRLSNDSTTPMPWSNVIANEQFGCLLTETGGGFTWFGNSRESKLTSWSNDPIVDMPSEALYIRDVDTGELFSPLPGIRRDKHEYWIQHGQGYSRFLHAVAGIEQELTISIAADDPVKFMVLRLQNRGAQPRRLSATYYAEWVLGVTREQTQMHLATSIDEASGALLATNAYHPEMPQQVAFLHVLSRHRSASGDRTEILGGCGNPRNPGGLQAAQLSGRTGAALDPAGAVQTSFVLQAGQSAEIVFLLGAGADLAAVQQLLKKYSTHESVEESIEQTIQRWEETLTAIQVRTPNRALDLLVNRWLVYQTLSCRVWGRSAFYQAAGAYGFRDQLQDVMALVYSRPDLARQHLLRAASRQFVEGDVQHWWHPPEGRGTRTRFSDDLLWLPHVVAHYLAATGDNAVLEEEVSFLTSPLLEDHEQERYELPAIATEKASLYEHCLRTIRRGFRLGPHGLPLMGCGDWNDGMNKVGEGGTGESVWVGWFLLVLLERFLPIMQGRGDVAEANDLSARAAELRASIEREAWDGGWYRRAYFDDGQPLGSATNDECQIDSIAQTWAVMAKAQPDRARTAVEAVWDRLVLHDRGLVLLFTPPFNESSLDPGYIKGYLPGIRENGGQYTHPALWLIEAFTLLGDGKRAMQIFDLINPIHHALTPAEVRRYQVEPYVIAADVYGVSPHEGRGGWTWYTGSASWTYRAALEFILGFKLRGDQVEFNPQVPPDWNEFEISFRHQGEVHRYLLRRGADGCIGPQKLDHPISDASVVLFWEGKHEASAAGVCRPAPGAGGVGGGEGGQDPLETGGPL